MLLCIVHLLLRLCLVGHVMYCSEIAAWIELPLTTGVCPASAKLCWLGGGSETAVNMGNFLPKLQFGKTGTIQGFRAFCKVLKNRGSFSIEFPGPRKSWKNSLILESPRN